MHLPVDYIPVSHICTDMFTFWLALVFASVHWPATTEFTTITDDLPSEATSLSSITATNPIDATASSFSDASVSSYTATSQSSDATSVIGTDTTPDDEASNELTSIVTQQSRTDDVITANRMSSESQNLFKIFPCHSAISVCLD